VADGFSLDLDYDGGRAGISQMGWSRSFTVNNALTAGNDVTSYWCKANFSRDKASCKISYGRGSDYSLAFMFGQSRTARWRKAEADSSCKLLHSRRLNLN
jgi:hypothetical protein